MARTLTFSTLDYCLLGGTLLFSLLIGAWHTLRSKQSNEDLLLGSGGMRPLPVAVSLTVSFLSAILILGTTAETYTNGVQFVVIVAPVLAGAALAGVLFLPILYSCQITSVFEYLDLRFHNRFLRTLCVLLYLLKTSLYMGISLYAPSLALSSTTTWSLAVSIVASASVGTLYTAFGGIKAVVWADVLQAVIMISGMLALIVQGAINVGGFTNIFAISAEHGRMKLFDFTLDPWQRHNFWNIFFGALFYGVTLIGTDQTSVQRYRSLPTLQAARGACFLSATLNAFFQIVATLGALAIFATYADCDPLKMKAIERHDQLAPYFVLDQMSHLTGLPGLFVACIMSGALSTISSGINSMAAITWQDLLRDVNFFKNMSAARQAWTTRIVSILYGCLSVALAFMASKLGGILQAVLSVLGAVNGPLLGVFTLGIFIPFANGKGAVIGFLASVAVAAWITVGSYAFRGPVETLPTSVAGCESNSTSAFSSMSITNDTSFVPAEPDHEGFLVKYVYGISYILYTMVGSFVCIIVGSLASLLTDCSQREVDASLVHPVAHTIFKSVNCLRSKPSSRDVRGENNIGFQMSAYRQKLEL